MRYAEGGELFTLKAKMNKFDERHVKFYIAQIALAIGYLHENLQLIHRCITKENILIGKDGYLALSDFSFCGVME
jgi:serine/threonine protein kinase